MTKKIEGLKTAAPYLRLFKGKTFVLKVGGEVLDSPKARDNFCEQAALLHQLGIKVVVVHGGGGFASDLCRRLGVPVETVNGRRITGAEALEVAKMAFNGKLNTDLLSSLQKHGVPCVGLSGIDGSLVQAQKRPARRMEPEPGGAGEEVDFGFVGDVTAVDGRVVEHLLDGGFLPVISSMAGNGGGEILNINADTLAAALAPALGAEKLIYLTGSPGVLRDARDPGSLISSIDQDGLEEVLGKSARGGMIAKLESCRDALDAGVPRAHIISGAKRDSLLIEIFTNEGCGTLIEKRKPEETAGAAP